MRADLEAANDEAAGVGAETSNNDGYRGKIGVSKPPPHGAGLLA
jgi:hypothetical protein